ncbi:hypothetical protein NDN08_001033 [Rhodosorus marinus]|uniref:Uncharacterized protein n=1 Tax=Rhodosorus marinus TaxID=101924 RepID=A0AAV8UPQ3_9RHOD|nr:hypothetical protein NDN08_001033 [Rhodosorus marinus]
MEEKEWADSVEEYEQQYISFLSSSHSPSMRTARNGQEAVPELDQSDKPKLLGEKTPQDSKKITTSE